MINQTNEVRSSSTDPSVVTPPEPINKFQEINGLVDLALKNRPTEPARPLSKKRIMFMYLLRRIYRIIKAVFQAIFVPSRPISICKEAQAFVEQKKLVLKSKNERSFRNALVTHYTDLSQLQKKQGNIIESYKTMEIANKIKGASSRKVYETFVRLQKQLAVFDNHDQLLSKIADGLKELNEPEREQLKEKLKDLHQATSELLVGYSHVSRKIDDIFAVYRGNFAHKFRKIDQLTRNSFTNLPLAPEKVAVTTAQKCTTIPDLKKKLEELKKSGNTTQAKSLERTLKDLQTIEEIKAKNGFTKSVVIGTCSFGTGHKITAQALKEHIGKAAHVRIIDPTVEILVEHRDWMYKLGKFLGIDLSGAKTFNWILQKQKYWIVNLENKIDNFFCRVFKKRKNGIAAPGDVKSNQILRQHLLMERPDLIATTYHMDLNIFLDVAREMGIPLVHIPTDMDVKMDEVFIGGIKPGRHFKIFIPDDNVATLKSANLGLNNLHFKKGQGESGSTGDPTPADPHNFRKNGGEVAGIPLRPEFYIQRTAQEIAEIKKEHGIDPEAKVVLVLSGGNGQELPYPEMLMNAPNNGQKYHMIIVAGGNKAAGDKFIKLSAKNPNVTIEVAMDPSVATEKTPYYVGASEMSRLHAISDVAITKPGGVSIAELLQTGVPMIPDRRMTPMVWEDFNIDVVKDSKRGLPYTGKENFLDLLDKVVSFGKKPKADRSKWFTEVMEEMIAEAEADVKLVQQRKYRQEG